MKDKVEREKLSERDQLIIFASVIAFSFFGLFLYIDKLPYNWVYTLYVLFTSDTFKLTLVGLIPVVLILTFKEKNIGYVLVLCSLMAGQFLFVHVFSDDYSLPQDQIKVEKKGRHMHYPNSNIG